MKPDMTTFNRSLLQQAQTDSKSEKSHKSTKINKYIFIIVSTMQTRRKDCSSETEP